MIRVLTGKAKGRSLKVPRGRNIRPTPAKVKAALFNVLGDQLLDSFFLDLFAGTGNVGIEALSRGACKAVFVERNSRATALIQENLVRCNFLENSYLFREDVAQALDRLLNREERFDFIFLDPPYEKGVTAKMLCLLAQRPLLVKPAGEIIAQHSPREVPLSAYGPLHRKALKSYGDTQLSFYTWQQ